MSREYRNDRDDRGGAGSQQSGRYNSGGGGGNNGGGAGGNNRNRFRRRKPRRGCPDYIDYKDVEFLQNFIPERGKILPRRISGVSASCQRRIAEAIKRARNIALLPFATD